MADEDIFSLLGQINSAATEPPLSLAEKVMGYSRSVVSGPTFNFADNIEAAVAAPFTDLTYGEELENIRSEQDRFKRNTDYLDNAVEIASGAILNPFDKIKKATQGAKYGANFLSTLVTNPASQAALSAVGADNGEDPLMAAGMGLAVGAGGAVLANKIGGVLGNASREADRLKTSAYGITAADIGKQIRKMGDAVDTIADADSIPIVRSLEKYEQAGVIKPDNDVIDNIKGLFGVQRQIGTKLGEVLKDADSVIPAKPDFQLKYTSEYIDALSGKAKVKAEEAAWKEVSALSDQLGSGSLEDLQRLKVGLNYKYDENPYTDDIVKALRSDLRQEIENRVDDAARAGLVDPDTTPGLVKYLNKEWGEAAELKNLFRKKAGADFGGDVISDTLLGASTTGAGATGTLNMAGAVTGNPAYWGVSAIMQGLKGNVAKSKLADFLREADQTKLSNVGKFLEKWGTARTSEQIYESTEKPKPYKGKEDSIESILNEINSLGGVKTKPAEPVEAGGAYSFMDKLFKGGKVDKVSMDVIDEVKKDPVDHAIMLLESGGDPEAKNPKSTASGLFQLLKPTAKALGVKNVFDAKENYEGYKKLKAETISKFKNADVELIYAAHYLGEPTLKKWLNGETLTEAQQEQVKMLETKLMPRLKEIYNGLIKV